MNRTLSLKRETLIVLTSDEMAALAGASVPTWIEPGPVNSLKPRECLATTQPSVLVCSGSGCHTWDSDCSCAI